MNTSALPSRLTREEVPRGWTRVFDENKEIIDRIMDRISTKGKYYPARHNLFRAFWECELSKVRVVIVGQDPYTKENQACGMSFSLPPGVAVTPSLTNIFKCIKKSYPDFKIPNHGDLRAWSKQGVLLLNYCLVYCPNNLLDKTQRMFCMPFINVVMREIYTANPNVIVVLWGNEAAAAIDLPGNVRKLKGVHPSGMNGNRFVNEVTHFKDINAMLETPIDWTL